jgi:DNA-binding NarL/FixJ family response regulator
MYESDLQSIRFCSPLGNSLSPRETEILKWVRGGKDDWEISVILNIGYETVKWCMEEYS